VYASQLVTEPAASWGLDRISSKATIAEGAPHQYKYDSSAGEGVCVYVIDTGVLVEHEVRLRPPPRVDGC
jgi:cerevisin